MRGMVTTSYWSEIATVLTNPQHGQQTARACGNVWLRKLKNLALTAHSRSQIISVLDKAASPPTVAACRAMLLSALYRPTPTHYREAPMVINNGWKLVSILVLWGANRLIVQGQEC